MTYEYPDGFSPLSANTRLEVWGIPFNSKEWYHSAGIQDDKIVPKYVLVEVIVNENWYEKSRTGRYFIRDNSSWKVISLSELQVWCTKHLFPKFPG